MDRRITRLPSPDPDTTGIFDTKAAAPVYGDASEGRAIRVVERAMDPDERRPSWSTEPVRLIVSLPGSPIPRGCSSNVGRESNGNGGKMPTSTDDDYQGSGATEATEATEAEDRECTVEARNNCLKRDLDSAKEELQMWKSYLLMHGGHDNSSINNWIENRTAEISENILQQAAEQLKTPSHLYCAGEEPQARQEQPLWGTQLNRLEQEWHRDQDGIARPLPQVVLPTSYTQKLYNVVMRSTEFSRPGGANLAKEILFHRLGACHECYRKSQCSTSHFDFTLFDQGYMRCRSPAPEALPQTPDGLGGSPVFLGPMDPPPPPTQEVCAVHPAPSDSGYGSMKRGDASRGRTLPDPFPAPQDIDGTLYDSEQPMTKGISARQTTDDDTATVYSNAGSLSDSRVDSCIQELADDLFHGLATRHDGPITREAMLHILHVLPGLLKYLALEFGYGASSKMHLNIMYFVHMRRHAITEAVRDRYISMEECDTARPGADSLPSSLDLVRGWLDGAHGTPDSEQPGSPAGDLEEADPHGDFDEDGIIQEVAEYTRLMIGSDAYRSFLASARAEASLGQDDTMNEIRETMNLALSPVFRSISRRRPPEICEAAFTVNWEPFTFLAEQGYAEPPGDAISSAITVTGSSVDAQATTVAQYLAQTWPSIGLDVLAKIQDLVRGHAAVVQGVLRDTTRFEAKFEQDPMTRLVFGVQGTPEAIVQVAQVLAWLGAALRCSRYMDQPQAAYSISHLRVTGSNLAARPKISCKISFGYTELPALHDSLGQCWHGLFRKLAVVKGFPIPCRSEPGLGLEIPLDMMAALVGSSKLDLFDAKVFIKGFSAMLVPTLRRGGIVVWHLVAQGDARISYLDWEGEHEQLAMAEMETARHVVGWCSQVTYDVGGPGAEYNVRRSLLPVAHAGCRLERAEISGGQLIHGTVTFALGAREKPIHVSRDGYIPKLKWITGKYVILWDEESRRGWLVNGASALLHLLRASLRQSRKDKFKGAFLFNESSFIEAKGHNNADSAIEVLINERNLRLPLYSERSETVQSETSKGQLSATRTSKFYCIQDRVEHLYGILEKMIDHQTAVERRGGVQMPEWPRRQLEGWDFREVFADRDPLYPRVAALDTTGKGWVDFTRGIHAITLFGRGFGDLMRPGGQSAAAACTRWSTLPRGSCYLAATVSDLMEIMRVDGDPDTNPRRLSERLLWYSKETSFNPCPCGETTPARKGFGPTSRHRDPVQALFPSRFWARLKRKAQAELPDRGAVVFGHNWSLHWYYGDSGDPQKGDPPSTALEQDAEEKSSAKRQRADSGLGSSLLSKTGSDSQDGSSWDNPQGEPSDASSHVGSGTPESAGTCHPADQNLSPKGSPPCPVESQEAILGGVKRHLAGMASSAKRMKLSRAWGGSGTE
ncbi:hypothetical protein RB595_006117 [Gaeumannomyces hyphopodioides]